MAHALRRLPWLLARIDALAQRWHQGTLPTPRHPASKRTATPAPAGAQIRMRDLSANGWLARIHPPSRQVAGQIAHLLAQDSSREFAAAAPQAGRLLRPLCRMLGVTPPDWLKLSPRAPRKPRRPRARLRRPSLTDPTLRLRPTKLPPHAPGAQKTPDRRAERPTPYSLRLQIVTTYRSAPA